ncbi:hypothetical protein B4113_2197 [Geobacillus sp. B4113_201601]|nr:hypothetical protein B4113_2197 [Geobacillus sp. B4113_201601]
MMKAESPLFYTFYSFAGKTNKERHVPKQLRSGLRGTR